MEHRLAATSIIQSLRCQGHFFWLHGKTAINFLVKKTLLIRPFFFVTLVTVLTGFHWSKKIRNEPPWDERPLTLKSGTLTTEWRSLFGIQANWYSSNSTKYWTFKRAQFRLNTPSEYNWWFLAFRTFRSSRSLLLGFPPSFLAALPLAPYVSSRSTVSDLKEK